MTALELFPALLCGCGHCLRHKPPFTACGCGHCAANRAVWRKKDHA